MEKEKISVIVPCYKVEEFLVNCIESIINQTYKNLEIILVDDGSPDSCGNICDDYQKKDRRIKVIHKENGGLSDARNAGMKVATGEYLAFVDSDDYINSNMYKCLYDNLKKYKADISICSIKKTDSVSLDKNVLEKNVPEVFSKMNVYENLYNNLAVETVVAWNKLYKRKVFKDIWYPVGKINEDEAIIHKLINNVKKVVYTPCKYYYYYQRPGSIMNDYKERNLGVFEWFFERGKFFRENGFTKLDAYNNYMICFQSTFHYNKVRKLGEKYDIIKKNLKKQIKEYGKLVKKSKDNTFFQKFVVSCFMLSSYTLIVFSKVNSILKK